MKTRNRLLFTAVVATILSTTAITQENSTEGFYVAIRANNLEQLTNILAGGANVNVKDERGITPLMYAAWVGSPEAMKLLLGRGADPNVTNSAGSTALMMSVTELAKVRLLVEGGADVNMATSRGRTALLLAAMSEPSADIVRVLLAAGANPKAIDAFQTTTLNAAAFGNDTETIRILLDSGVGVEGPDFAGFTPLINASSNGNLEAVRLLLAKGANVNAVSGDGAYQKVKAGTIALARFTPLISAAAFGSPDLVRALLDAGANVNAQEIRGMTPLMLAVATDRQNPETARTLIARGADLNIKSAAGETALDWARKIGARASIETLTKAGATGTAVLPVSLPPFAPADLRTSVQRSVALLEKTSIGAAANGGCASCHAHNITDLVANLARSKGVAIDQKAAGDRLQLTKAPYFSPLNLLERLDGPGSPDVPLFALGAMAAQGYKPDRTTDAVLANVMAHQSSNGRWGLAGGVARPPIEDGDIFRTALAISAMKNYAPAGRTDIPARFAKAREWLVAAEAKTSEDRNMQLIGLERAGVEKSVLQRLAKAIVAAQRPDGGWAQRAEFQSDAYATGQTLFALASTGVMSPNSQVYQKGVKFLLSRQHGDGSWFVRSRSPKFQPFFESGFPYGHDQWISSMATGWAAAALTLALDEPKKTADVGRRLNAAERVGR
jgi:ankyrin repeat protein